jgi:hypothetical protein
LHGIYLSFSFFLPPTPSLCSSGDWTLGSAHARKALNYVSHALSPFVFWNRVSMLPLFRLALQPTERLNFAASLTDRGGSWESKSHWAGLLVKLWLPNLSHF